MVAMKHQQLRKNLPSFAEYEEVFKLVVKLKWGKNEKAKSGFFKKKKNHHTSKHQPIFTNLDNAIFSLAERCYKICRGIAKAEYEQTKTTSNQPESTIDYKKEYQRIYNFLGYIKKSEYPEQSSHKDKLKEFLDNYNNPYSNSNNGKQIHQLTKFM